jgi:branched-chain amino acid transport system substrate-binding protein
MKRYIALFLACFMLVGLLAGCSSGSPSSSAAPSNPPSSSSNVIKIGIYEPASGMNGAGGKQETLGMRYAHSVKPTVTIGGKEYTVELVEVDNQSDNSKAVSAAQQLITSGVSVVLGSYGSGVSIAAGQIFADAKIPAIGASCTNPQVTEGNPYYFRICFLDPFQGTVMANFAYEKGLRKAAVLTEAGDDYSVGLGHYFSEAFKKLGGSVVEAQFQSGETDFSATMASLVSAGVDVLFAPSSIESAPLIIKQARNAGLTGPIMAGDTWENETIITNAGDAAYEVYLSAFFDPNDTSAAAKEFVEGYTEWLKADNTRLTNNGGSTGVAGVSALGYDAYMVAIAAIEAAQSTDGTAIRDALIGLQHSGVTGECASFDENGDAAKDMAYIKTIDLQNATFKFLQTQSIS